MNGDDGKKGEKSSVQAPASVRSVKYTFRFFATNISEWSEDRGASIDDHVSIILDTSKIDQSTTPAVSLEFDNKGGGGGDD